MAVKDSKYDDWAVDDAVRTLLRSEEIKKDSKMMGLVQKKLKKKKAEITSLQQLRDIANSDTD